MSGTITPAAPSSLVTPAGLAPAGWQAAVDKVTKYGTYSAPEGLPETIGLVTIRGPLSGTHHADYMNLRGEKRPDGKFETGYVTLVSEAWEQRADGNFHIDQWFHRLSPDGTHELPVHVFLVETSDREVLDSGVYHVSEGDPAATANLNALIAFWGQYTPPAAASAAMLRDGIERRPRSVIAPRAKAPLQLQTPQRRGGN